MIDALLWVIVNTLISNIKREYSIFIFIKVDHVLSCKKLSFSGNSKFSAKEKSHCYISTSQLELQLSILRL